MDHLTRRSPRRRGRALTDAEKAEVRAERAARGTKVARLATRFDVSPAQISRVLNEVRT